MKKQHQKPKGSILIWTVLLGVSLSAVFFFFAQRLNFNAAVQRKSIAHQNTMQFIESYADYLASLSQAELQTLVTEPNFQDQLNIINQNLNGASIVGNLNIVTNEINGKIPPNDSVVHEIHGGDALIEWNLCNLEDGRPLLVTPNIDSEEFDLCGSEIYENRGVLSDVFIEIYTEEAPVSYRITPLEETTMIIDDQWTLDLQIEFSPKKRVRVRRRW